MLVAYITKCYIIIGSTEKLIRNIAKKKIADSKEWTQDIDLQLLKEKMINKFNKKAGLTIQGNANRNNDITFC